MESKDLILFCLMARKFAESVKESSIPRFSLKEKEFFCGFFLLLLLMESRKSIESKEASFITLIVGYRGVLYDVCAFKFILLDVRLIVGLMNVVPESLMLSHRSYQIE